MILILIAGTSYNAIRTDYGEFEDWIKEKMNLNEDEYFVHPIGNYQRAILKTHFS